MEGSLATLEGICSLASPKVVCEEGVGGSWQAGLHPSLTQQATPYRPIGELEGEGVGSLVPGKMTGQKILEDPEYPSKAAQLFLTTSLVPMEQPTTATQGGPSKGGSPSGIYDGCKVRLVSPGTRRGLRRLMRKGGPAELANGRS